MGQSGLVKAGLVGVFSVTAALGLAAGCSASAPSAEEITTQFNEVLATAQDCTADVDCTVVIAGCPLGTFVAVNREQALTVDEAARQLLRRYAQKDQVCANATDEVAPGARCTKDKKCETFTIEGTPPPDDGDKDAGQTD